MKTIPAGAVALALLAIPAFAQQPAPPKAQPAPAAVPERGSPAAIDAVRKAVREDKRALVAKNMELTEAEAKKFWPLYDAYQKDIEAARQKQNRAVLDYVNQYSSMNDANAKRIAREIAAADAEEHKLAEKMLTRLYAVMPARKAVRYMQIENKIRLINEYDMAAQLPLVQ